MNIKFSPPDITDSEIAEVVDALRSGWITTGPKTKLFESKIADYCGTAKSACLNSATAGMELVLRILGVGEGDEVITSAYTYTASASVIDHVGAKIVLCDTAPNSFEMDYDKLESLITDKTKVIIPVDIAGKICDYARVFEIVEKHRIKFNASNDMQKILDRVVVMSDGAHSFGASRDGIMSGNIADFTSFSFHAVKNLTTAEGGAVTWKTLGADIDDKIYKQFMLWSLHGQSKDALAKTQIGSWEYDIQILGQKCNMTDVSASIGLSQLNRYQGLLDIRREIIGKFDKALSVLPIDLINHYGDSHASSGHLYLTRLVDVDEKARGEIIIKMAERGIATNVHYKPLPMHTAYIAKGFDIKDFPNAYNQYFNEITLPLHTLLTDDEIDYIITNFIDIVTEYL